MMQIKQLKQFSEYAQHIKTMIDAKRAEATGEEKLLMEQLYRAAAKVEDTIHSPLKIGIVGEFSAGKTFLIGALFGYADMLPVSEIPTTGNVTRLRFKQHQGEAKDEIRPSNIDTYSIEYMDAHSVKQALSHMLKELENRAIQAKLNSALLSQIQQLRTEDPPRLNDIQKWCEETWKESHNASLRTLIREVVIFLRVQSQCNTILGQRYEVSEDVAREGLTLPVLTGNLSSDTFHSIPPPPARLEQSPTSLTTSLIRLTFPLIRRCEVTVNISKKIWDLSPVKGQNDFVLIDFPGLGAETSGVRDAFLCLRELEDVQTILILLNANKPGAGEAQEIFNLMQQHHADLQDRVLVGVSRFNQLPITPDEWERMQSKLPQPVSTVSLSDDDEDNGSLLSLTPTTTSANLRESDVYQAFPALQVLATSAGGLTSRPDRIVFLAPPLYFHHLHQKYPDLPTTSKGYSKEMAEAIRRSLAQKEQFSRVIEALKTSGSADKLTRWLEQAYSSDGGIFTLRQLFHSHVAEHGLQQTFEQASREVTLTEQCKQKLCHFLSRSQAQQPLPAQTKDIQTIQDRVGDLLQTFLRLDAGYKNESVDFSTSTQGREISLSQIVEEEVTSRFYRWPVWQEMLHTVDEQGYITPPSLQKKPGLDLFGGLLAPEETPFADTSEEFLSLFVQECRELEVWLQPHIEQALKRWLEQITVEVAPFRGQLGPAIQRAQQRPELTPKQKASLQVLHAAFTLESLLPQFLQAVLRESMDKQDISRWQKVFPLNLQQKFAWHPDVVSFCPPTQRHQIVMMRVREEMIAGALRELSELLGQSVVSAKHTLRSTLKQIITALEQLRLNAPLLQLLTELPSSSALSPEEQAQLPLFAQLRALSNPIEQSL